MTVAIGKVAIVTLSAEGARVAAALRRRLGVAETDVYVHAAVSDLPAGLEQARRFTGTPELTAEIFPVYRGIVFVLPCGLAVRAIAPHVRSKLGDPAVVVVDVGGRWAVSLLSGHEGGANELAMAVANALAAEPVITTTTDAAKTLIVGVGCRRGASCERIVAAVKAALIAAKAELDQVRLLASVDVKRDEAGLAEAARTLGVPLRLIGSEELRACARRDFEPSDLAREKLGVPAVAEPCALLAGRRTQLLLNRLVIDGVTVAIARENCSWSD